jgi:hypothetical protein
LRILEAGSLTKLRRDGSSSASKLVGAELTRFHKALGQTAWKYS